MQLLTFAPLFLKLQRCKDGNGYLTLILKKYIFLLYPSSAEWVIDHCYSCFIKCKASPITKLQRFFKRPCIYLFHLRDHVPFNILKIKISRNKRIFSWGYYVIVSRVCNIILNHRIKESIGKYSFKKLCRQVFENICYRDI